MFYMYRCCKIISKSKNGFTLLELLIVITVVGILASLAIPNIIKIADDYRLNEAAKEIAREIINTQQLAMYYGIDMQFEIDIYNNQYSVRTRGTPSKLFKRGQLDRSMTIATNLYNPGYSGSYKGIRTLYYSPSGMPSRTGTIWLYSKTGGYKRITIAVGTGRVKIWD